MLAIAQWTMLETIRRKLLPVSVGMSSLFLGLFAFLLSQLQGTATGPVGSIGVVVVPLGLGLFCVDFLLAFFAIFSVAGTISGDVENGTLAVVAARPLPRWQILVGKWLGFAAVQSLYVTFLFFAFLFLMHAYFPNPLPLTAADLAAWSLFLLQSWVLSAVTLLGSVLLPPLANGIAIALWFLVTFVAGALAQLPIPSNPGIVDTALVTGWLLPTDLLYRLALAQIAAGAGGAVALPLSFMGPLGVEHIPGNGFLVVAGIYPFLMLGVAAWAFARREI